MSDLRSGAAKVSRNGLNGAVSGRKAALRTAGNETAGVKQLHGPIFSFLRRTGWELNERHTMNWFKRTHVTHINGRLAIYGYLPRKRYFLAVWR